MSAARPSLKTTPSASPVTLDASSVTLKDTAVLSDANAPTGSITFDLSQKTTFEGHIIFTSIDTETMTVSGNGTYTTPTGYTLPTTGNVVDTYRWDARYSGDSNNASVSATEEQLDVIRARPSLSTTRTQERSPSTLRR